MRRPLLVRWRLAKSLVKFTGHRGPNAWWFIIRYVLRGER